MRGPLRTGASRSDNIRGGRFGGLPNLCFSDLSDWLEVDSVAAGRIMARTWKTKSFCARLEAEIERRLLERFAALRDEFDRLRLEADRRWVGFLERFEQDFAGIVPAEMLERGRRRPGRRLDPHRRGPHSRRVGESSRGAASLPRPLPAPRVAGRAAGRQGRHVRRVEGRRLLGARARRRSRAESHDRGVGPQSVRIGARWDARAAAARQRRVGPPRSVRRGGRRR